MARAFRLAIALVAAVGVALVAARLYEMNARDVALPAPREAMEGRVPAMDAFAGAERCAECHLPQFQAWGASTHGRAGGPPNPRNVIAPFAGVIRFSNAVVLPRVRGSTYTFEVIRHGEEPVTLRVDGVVGGGHIYGGGTQAFVSDLADGSWRMLPFEWSRQAAAWFCNTNPRTDQGWRRIAADMPLEACGDWPPVRALGDHPRYANCQSCHASQATVRLDTLVQGYETRFTSLAINCESCHGPARAHADAAARGAADAAPMPPLAAQAKDASLGTCLSCHAVKDQLRPGYVAGDSLESFYSLKLPLLGDRPLHPDGRIRTFAYQEGHLFSDCYVNGGMTCVSCHDPHGQGYRTVGGQPLADRFDDRQCVSCHVSKTDRVAHTRHASERVSCVSCHMPARQLASTHGGREIEPPVPYRRYDHTISIPRPSVDSVLGLSSACAACHATMNVAEQEASIARWWGAVKPMPEAWARRVVARGAASAPALLGAGGDAEPAISRFYGVSRFLETFVDVDADLPRESARRLRDLAASEDVDVSAVALAALHLSGGGTGRERRTLAEALRKAGGRDLPLRLRWATALGFMGDRYAAGGDGARAVAAYTRALEVMPTSGRLLGALANARRDAGDLAGAIATYQRSIAVEPLVPLTWVNLGIALTHAGDARGAETALSRALSLDAAEPLAWYNLGNLALFASNLPRAEALYARAVALDASLTEGHFQRARVALLRADSTAALRHLARGLAFDSSNAAAVAERNALAARLARP